MTTTGKTPLWLDLKKEYVDDNFTKLQGYLRNGKENKDDAFYDTTLQLFEERIVDLLKEISDRRLYDNKIERKSLVTNINMLATFLLAESDSSIAMPAFVAMLNELRQLNPRISDMLVRIAITRMRFQKVVSLGYTWKDIEKIDTELFAYNLCTNVSFSKPVTTPLVFSRYGTALLTGDGLMLTYENDKDAKRLVSSGADSLDTGLAIKLRTKSADKLKQSKENSVVDMDEFTKDFILSQNRNQPKNISKVLRTYSDDQEVVVKVVSSTHRRISVVTVDPKYNQLSGSLAFTRDSIVYYRTDTLYEYFRAGDYLTATIIDAEKGLFSIEKQLIEFFVEDLRTEMEDSGYILAKVIDEQPSYTEWLTQWGEAVQIEGRSDYHHGNFALISITEYCTGKYYGLIKGEIYDDTTERFNEQSARNDCIRTFADMTKAPVEQQEEDNDLKLSPTLLKILLRMLYDYQKSLLKPSDRYRCLANACIMAEMVGDVSAASYITFDRTYLRALIQFVNNEDLKRITLEPDDEYKNSVEALVKISVIELLKEYGRRDNSERLASTIWDFKDKIPQLAKLARLIQTANSMQDFMSGPSLNVIRREIIRTLSIETENDADLEADKGIYLGIESGTLEFKTSIIFPPNNNMQASEFSQNENVMKGICAFLNSTTGGTLYLGVNDQGYVVGLQSDLEYLKTTSLDTYKRYVQDVAKKYFGVDTLPYLRIETLYDDTVVAVYVDPHPYRLVELNGVAYLRVNAESRIMPEEMRQQLIDRKVFTNKDRAAAVSCLQHACTQKKCVCLRNYASNNSQTVSDRHVEAYDIRPEDGLVICYDLDKKDIRVFSINRIGYVEILEQSWGNTAQHRQMKVDVFHMSGQTTTPVTLQLDLMAKNLLVEEYPSAKDRITQDKKDPSVWYFSDDVCQMQGIGRFYIGLAGHIKILEGDALKQYVRQQIEEISRNITE